MAPPPTFQGTAANVTEHLGAALPLDAVFRDQDGKQITLRQVVTGDLPTILTFNYADCPMLCSQQLNGLTAAMPGAAKRGPVPGSGNELAFALGEHYRIVTISLEPNENQAKLVKMRSKYLERVGKLSSDAGITLDAGKLASGWTFLTGDAMQVKRVADAVGFGYAYLPDRGEWAHPAAFMFLSSAGVITRYVYGIEFPDRGVLQVREEFRAGVAHGSRTRWHPNGAKASEAAIVNGQIVGLFRRWREDGTLAEEIGMDEGQPHGISRSFFPSGFIQTEARLEHGKVVEQASWADGEKRPHPPTPPTP